MTVLHGATESYARNLADGLVLFVDVVVAGKQKSTVATGTFTSAMVTTNHHEVQRVTDAFQVVFL